MLTFKDTYEEQIKHLVEYAKKQMPSGVEVCYDGGVLFFEATVGRISGHFHRWRYGVGVADREQWYRWRVDDDRGALIYIEGQIELARRDLQKELK